MRRLTGLLLAAVVATACARMASPPGGPMRRIPPALLAVFPDSGTAPCGFREPAVFQFDEVTSDAGEPNFGTGSGVHEKLILFSPDTLTPEVQWHRDRITVRPRGGWRDSVVYRIEMLPGLLDLRQNITKTGSVIAFAVCGPKPVRTISGRVIDWVAERPVPSALVELFHLPDSARYRTTTDSTGRFHIESLPNGPYFIVATIDQNHDHKRNGTEAWERIGLAATSDSAGEIWTYARDTLPIRILDVSRLDSQAVAVRFNKPIDPNMRGDTALIRVGLLAPPDTISIGVLGASPKAFDDSTHKTVVVRDTTFIRDSVRRDSIQKAAPAPPSSARGAGGKTPVVPDPPKEIRLKLGDVLVIRTRGQLVLGSNYWVQVHGVRTPDGRSSDPAGRVLVTLTEAEKAKAKADSIAKIKAKTDSAKADSIKKAKGDTTTVKPIKPR